VSEVGLGCNRLGQDYAADEHWIALVRQAVDVGVTLFDTSEVYAAGRSEEMLGRALGNRADVVIATKIGWDHESGAGEFTAARMMTAVEDSLRRLQRDTIDVYQLHSPRRVHLERCDWVDGMVKLKAQGKIRVAAVAVDGLADGIWLMERDLVEALQITYNIFNVEAEERLFALAEEKGVGLLCRMPLARGVLTGKFHPGQAVSDDHRATLDGERMWENVRRAESLRPLAATYEGGMTRLAHHFSLTPRAISAIIPGARTPDQLEENVAASNGVGLAETVRAEIERVRATW
jgi:aryl-alcohol dehydrogenase-like predicted oxidoreductase